MVEHPDEQLARQLKPLLEGLASMLEKLVEVGASEVYADIAEDIHDVVRKLKEFE